MNMFYGVLALLISLACFYGAAYWLRLRQRVLGWPTVRGRVTARTAIQPTDRGRMSSPAFRWAPDVRFCYRVNGTDYDGDKTFLPWSWTNSKVKVDAFLATIPDEVDVRYDPADPKTSCLFPPANSNALIYGLTGIGVLLFSAMWLLPLLTVR